MPKMKDWMTDILIAVCCPGCFEKVEAVIEKGTDNITVQCKICNLFHYFEAKHCVREG